MDTHKQPSEFSRASPSRANENERSPPRGDAPPAATRPQDFATAHAFTVKMALASFACVASLPLATVGHAQSVVFGGAALPRAVREPLFPTLIWGE